MIRYILAFAVLAAVVLSPLWAPGCYEAAWQRENFQPHFGAVPDDRPIPPRPPDEPIPDQPPASEDKTP